MLFSVLVVDNNADLREAIAEVLRGSGYEVSQAENGQCALEYLERTLPSLMLLDLSMPVLDGWQLVKRLRSESRYSHLPIVVLSSGFGAVTGADFVLRKPANADQLLKAVAQFTRGRLDPRPSL